MTDTDLRALLDDAAGEPPVRVDGRSVRALATEPTRRPSWLLPLAAAAAVAALALVVPQLVSRPSDGGPAGLPDGALRLNGVAVVLPEGWTTGTSVCGQQRPRTVAIQPGLAFADCPLLPAHYSGPWLRIQPVHLDQVAYTWTGNRTEWKGQQAFRAVRPGEDGVLVTLTVPALNAQVSAAAPDEDQADALLDDVIAAPQEAVDPDDWTTVHLLALQDSEGDPRPRTAATLTGERASQLLSAVAAAPRSDAEVCEADWDGGTVLLRLDNRAGDHRDLAVRTGDYCPQVFTGGQLKTVTAELQRLLDDALTDPSTAPPAVAAAAERLRSSAPDGSRTLWVRTSYGKWRELRGDSGAADAGDDVYVVQVISPSEYVCLECSGLTPVRGTVATAVFSVRGSEHSEFSFSRDDFGLPELPGVREIR